MKENIYICEGINPQVINFSTSSISGQTSPSTEKNKKM